MPYKITAHYPGRLVRLSAADEETALAKCDELVADGVSFEILDSEGHSVDVTDLEDRLDIQSQAD
jgi:hypothetical protein